MWSINIQSSHIPRFLIMRTIQDIKINNTSWPLLKGIYWSYISRGSVIFGNLIVLFCIASPCLGQPNFEVLKFWCGLTFPPIEHKSKVVTKICSAHSKYGHNMAVFCFNLVFCNFLSITKKNEYLDSLTKKAIKRLLGKWFKYKLGHVAINVLSFQAHNCQ